MQYDIQYSAFLLQRKRGYHMDMDFWAKLAVVIFVMFAQGVLWSWVGWRASRDISWWPLMNRNRDDQS